MPSEANLLNKPGKCVPARFTINVHYDVSILSNASPVYTFAIT